MNEIMNIGGIDCYEKDGIAYLKLEAVARGLGFTKTDVKVSETGFRKEYIRIDWPRVEKYLNELNFATCGKRPDFIPENIFYRLAMKAKNEAAERFQAKIADEVIPSIRKHGAYMTPAALEEAILNPDFGIRLLTALKDEQEKRRALEVENERMRPMELFAKAVSASHSSILIGDLAKLLKQNGVDIGQKRLFAWMRDNGYLIKRKGADWNMPTQYSMDLGLFEVKESTVNNPDGSVRINRTTKVTGKGQQYFINKFLAAA